MVLSFYKQSNRSLLPCPFLFTGFNAISISFYSLFTLDYKLNAGQTEFRIVCRGKVVEATLILLLCLRTRFGVDLLPCSLPYFRI